MKDRKCCYWSIHSPPKNCKTNFGNYITPGVEELSCYDEIKLEHIFCKDPESCYSAPGNSMNVSCTWKLINTFCLYLHLVYYFILFNYFMFMRVSSFMSV